MPEYTIRSKHASVVAIDQHARSVTVSAICLSTGEMRGKKLTGCPGAADIVSWAEGWLAAPIWFIYESGPCGFQLARDIRALGHDSDSNSKRYQELSRVDLLILDEFGYIPLDSDGGRLLFQVMSNCYERQSMALTTNIELGKWGTVLADAKLASALVDRIVHQGRLVEFKGESRRVADSLMLGNRKEG